MRCTQLHIQRENSTINIGISSHYMAKILPILHKTLFKESINISINILITTITCEHTFTKLAAVNLCTQQTITYIHIQNQTTITTYLLFGYHSVIYLSQHNGRSNLKF